MANQSSYVFSRAKCEALDGFDTLRNYRDRFSLPEGVIYLDGNSLGALPKATAARVESLIREEWGCELIRSWNKHGWITLPQRVSGKLSRLLGASADEVIVADSTSINLFKLLAGALAMPDVKDRRIILSERDNFPTDLYIAEGVNAMLGSKYTLRLVAPADIEHAFTPDVAVAMITQVDYRTGRLHDMARVNERAKQARTRVVWDLSHSAGAIQLQLNDHNAELAVGCGYKYLNGGPGAPAYIYLAKRLQSDFATPLSGWFGHLSPFSFASTYTPAAGIGRLLCGTPSIMSMAALECGIDTFEDVELKDLRKKSLALSALFRTLVDQECGELGPVCVSPTESAHLGSQLSFAHEHAYPIMQALIDRGVIGDFRQPNLMRFGFAPLYVRFVDCWDAVITLRDIMLNGAWKADKYHLKKSVT